MLKKLILGVSIAGLTSSAFAGTSSNQMTLPSGINLIAPNSTGAWSFGVEALYTQPSNEDTFDYAQINSNAVSSNPTPYLTNQQINRKEQWGGSLDIDYLFVGNSRDVKLAYTRLRYRDSNTNSVTSPATLRTPFDHLTTRYSSALGKQNTDYDDIDLVFGQKIEIGQRLNLHPFAGLRYAEIDTNLKGYYTRGATSGLPAGDDTGTFYSDFKGLGPRVGMDANVNITHGFSVVGTAGISLLVGNIDSEGSEAYYQAATPPQPIAGVKNRPVENGDHIHTVPEADLRLGLDYNYNFNPSTSADIQIGYQAVNYFNGSDLSFDGSNNTNSENGSQNFGYYGPYLRFQLNVA